MTNEERDKMMIEMHGNIKVIVSQVAEHHTFINGNGKPGAKEDVATLKINQTNCPARKAQSTDNKRLNLAMVALVVAILTAVSNLAYAVMSGK